MRLPLPGAASMAVCASAARKLPVCVLQDVEGKMHSLGLPMWLKRKIRGYYAFQWMPNTGQLPLLLAFHAACALPPNNCASLKSLVSVQIMRRVTGFMKSCRPGSAPGC